jgi:hypothetical protein
MAASKTPAKKASLATKSPAKQPAAAKKAPARSVPKESPLKGMSVDDWREAKVSGWQAEAVKKLCRIVRAAAPGASSSIKWGQPVFESDGPFAFIRPAKTHVTFGFWRGTEIADPKKLLEGSGDRMAHVKFESIEAIDERSLSAMIKEAVRLNREKGSPTLRGKA